MTDKKKQDNQTPIISIRTLVYGGLIIIAIATLYISIPHAQLDNTKAPIIAEVQPSTVSPIDHQYTGTLSKTAFCIEMALYMHTVNKDRTATISWLQSAKHQASNAQTQDAIQSVTERLQSTTLPNFESLVITFHTLCNNLIDIIFAYTKEAPTTVSTPSTSPENANLINQFIHSNFIITHHNTQQDLSYQITNTTQQSKILSLLHQAQLALIMRYNTYFHTILNEIFDLLPQVLPSQQTTQFIQTLQPFKQYDIAHTDDNFTELLNMDLTDSTADNNIPKIEATQHETTPTLLTPNTLHVSGVF